MAENEWTDSAEKAAWRALVPEAASQIAEFYAPGEQVGDGLAEILAVRVLNVAFKHRERLANRAEAWDEGYEAAGETNPHVGREDNPYVPTTEPTR